MRELRIPRVPERRGYDDELDEIVNGQTGEGRRKLAFLVRVQSLHDGANEVEEFLDTLDVLADGTGLHVAA